MGGSVGDAERQVIFTKSLAVVILAGTKGVKVVLHIGGHAFSLLLVCDIFKFFIALTQAMNDDCYKFSPKNMTFVTLSIHSAKNIGRKS